MFQKKLTEHTMISWIKQLKSLSLSKLKFHQTNPYGKKLEGKFPFQERNIVSVPYTKQINISHSSFSVALQGHLAHTKDSPWQLIISYKSWEETACTVVWFIVSCNANCNVSCLDERNENRSLLCVNLHSPVVYDESNTF